MRPVACQSTDSRMKVAGCQRGLDLFGEIVAEVLREDLIEGRCFVGRQLVAFGVAAGDLENDAADLDGRGVRMGTVGLGHLGVFPVRCCWQPDSGVVGHQTQSLSGAKSQIIGSKGTEPTMILSIVGRNPYISKSSTVNSFCSSTGATSL